MSSNESFRRETKKSYSLSTVLRMCTVAKALRQSAEMAKAKEEEIDKLNQDKISAHDAEAARESLRDKVEEMTLKCSKLEKLCRKKRSYLEKLTYQNECLAKSVKEVSTDHDNIKLWLNDMKNNFVASMDSLKCKRKLLHWRRSQMMVDISDIFQIKQKNGLCYIADVPLPDAILLPKQGVNPNGSVPVQSFGAIPFSTMQIAIGYAAHYLMFLHWLFSIQPRYKIVYRGSHSAIFDHILPQLSNDSERTFPLYFQEKSSYQRFRYAIFLLARVASQLRYNLSWKKQSHSGAQLLENISWTVHDLLAASSHFIPPPNKTPLQNQLTDKDGTNINLRAESFSHSEQSASSIMSAILANTAQLAPEEGTYLGNPSPLMASDVENVGKRITDSPSK